MENQTLIIVASVLFAVAALLALVIGTVFYLTGGQTYDVPVPTSNIPKNTRIEPSHIQTKTLDESPEGSVIQDQNQVVGKVTTRNLKTGELFQPDDLRDRFEVVFSTRTVPAGNRIDATMIQVRSTNQKPSSAVSSPDQIIGKMVRESIPADQVVRTTQLYMNEKDYVVAVEPIKPNTMIREEQVRVESRPSGPSDAVTDPSEIIGKPVKRKIPAGKAVRKSDLYTGPVQLSYFIPMYKRGITIPVENHNRYSNMMKPGDIVDLYAYAPRQVEQGDNQETQYTLQKVADASSILSLNDKFTREEIRQYEQGGEKPRQFSYQEITLSVSLREAERVSLMRGMQTSGQEISFFTVLRPRILKSNYGINRNLTDFELFNPEAEGSMDQIQGTHSVEVIHGDQREIYKVPGR